MRQHTWRKIKPELAENQRVKAEHMITYEVKPDTEKVTFPPTTVDFRKDCIGIRKLVLCNPD